MNYETIIEDPVRKAFNETNDCAVIALSIVCQKPYLDVHTTFMKVGRKYRKGVSLGMIKQVIVMLTGTAPEYKFAYHEFGKRVTVSKVGNFLNRGRYVAITRNHCLAVVDGNVQDWTNGRKHQVQTFMKVA